MIETNDYVKKKKEPKSKPEVKRHEEPTGKYPTKELPQENIDLNPIYKVPDVLYAKDPIILDTKAKLREENFRAENPWNAKNPFKCKADKWLSMNVSQELEDRAIRIYATIIKAIQSKGYELMIVKDDNRHYPQCTTFIVIRGHKIQTHIREATSHGNKILKFECDEYEYHYGSSYDKCAAQDTKYTKLEDKIEHIIEVLERIADNRDERERQRKLEEERRKVEEERKRLEEEERKRLQALKDAELEKVRELIFNSDRLKIARIIREYVEEFRLHMQEQGLSDEAAMLNEIEWMKKKADFIDPFVKYPDELLTEKDIEKLINPEIIKTSESKPSYSYYHSEPQYSYWQIKNIWRKM
jgi:ACT domain-containing protein